MRWCLISPPSLRPEGTKGLLSVHLSVSLSVHRSVNTSFSDYSWLGFQIFSKLPYEELQIKLTFFTVDLLFSELGLVDYTWVSQK